MAKIKEVPLLDLKSQLAGLRNEIVDAVIEVIDSTRYIMGEKVEALEKEIADYTGTTHGIGVSSGTDALLLALMAYDIGPGDYVITSNFSFFATAGTIARLGAKPVFVDIDPLSFNIDPAKLEETLGSLTEDGRKRVKAIIPVHLYGQCAEMSLIANIGSHYRIPVIEDAAQAIGAEYMMDRKIKRAGSLGDIGCFSFFPSKNLGGIGDGGMVVTDSKPLAEKMRILRNHGAEPKYYHQLIGGNFRLDPIQAVVLSLKLPHLNQWHQQRKKNANRYTDMIRQSGIHEVQTPIAQYQAAELSHEHIYNQYMIRVPQRDALREFLASQNITTEVYYPIPFHLQECFQYLGYRKGDFPVSEQAAKEVLALPVYPELTEPMQKYVVDSIKKFYQSAASKKKKGKK
jgi:dTDP-4-amino-4,6-dideoxygalactose transaminase